MKRFFTSLIMVAAMLCGTTAWADNYSIWVGGLQVTDDNKNDINPSGKTSGTITFSGSTLTFTDVTMSSTKSCISISTGSAITIKFKGTNTLTTTSETAHCIYSTAPLTLNGGDWNDPASLTLNCTDIPEGKGYHGIFANFEGELSIWNLYLSIHASGSGAIVGNGDLTTEISTSCSQVRAGCGAGYAAVRRFKTWDMDDKGRLTNYDVFDATDHRTENNKGEVDNDITLMNGLYIGRCMPRVSSSNSYTYTPPGQTAGTIKYYNGKLTLSGVTMETGSYVGINNCNVPNLEIETTGTCTITSNTTCLQPWADTKLTGAGTLVLTSNSYSAISTNYGANVTVEMGELQAKGATYGFCGQSSRTLTLKKYSNSSIYKFAGSTCNIYTGKLVMDEMDIWTTNTYFNASECRMWANGDVAHAAGIGNGTWFKSTSAFSYYPVYVAGTHVSDRNSDNVHSPYITSGTVSYSNTTNTLTLDGVQFEATGDDAPIGIDLRSGMEETTLKFTGDDQHWTTDNDVFAFANSKTTISGDCKRVYLTSNAESGISTRNGASVTIQTSGYFGSKGAKYGYWGNGSSNEVLTLAKASDDGFGYNFEGTEGAIYNVTDFKLNNLDFGYIESNGHLPGCYFDATKRHVVQNGGQVAKGIVSFSYIKEKLPIYVAGKQLNRLYENQNSPIYVGSPYITSGPMSVKYTPATKALTLNDATIVEHGNNNTTYTCGIGVTGEGVTINVKGTNNITAGNYGIYTNSDLLIMGTGNLNVTSTELGALALYDTGGGFTMTLQFSEGVQSFQGKTYGFCGWNNATLAINKVGNGALYKFAGETADIGTVKNLALGEGVRIHSKYTWFNEDKKAMYRYADISKNTDIDYGTWIRGDVAWIDYPLYICDTQLYGAYVDGVLKGPVSGFCCKAYGGTGISYDPETTTLNMNGVTIDDTNVSNAVYNEGIDGLTINMLGDNNFKVSDNVFKLSYNTTITGDGTVKGELSANDGFGIWLNASVDDDLTLDGPTFEFKGEEAIGGNGNNNVTINSKLTFEPNDYATSALYTLSSVTFGNGMAITFPEGAWFSPDLGAVTTDGGAVYNGKVVIDDSATPYQLKIAGVTVTDANQADILHDGVFSYAPSTKTLTINGDCTCDQWIIESKIEDLTINVIGSSTLTQQGSGVSLIRLFGNTTITGGKLTLKGDGSVDNALGIYISDAEYLLIRNAYMEIDGEACEYGITSDGTTALLIDHSDLSISAHNEGCIIDWASISLTNCFIQKPEVSVIKPNGIYGIEDHLMGSGDATETVVIKAGELTGIYNTEQSIENNSTIYDLNGRKVNGQPSKGIYIQNGKKVVK